MLCLSADPAHLPSFHTCVGANEERLTPKWYREHGKFLFFPISSVLVAVLSFVIFFLVTFFFQIL